ncbi:MAG: type I-C CRISPR-associated protein Cas8c/Csd1 [Chloroflexi bacterium OHK40]
MLLQRLKEYADERMELPPPLYSETVVRYIVELDPGGVLLNPRPIDTADPSSPRTRRGERYLMPQVQRTSGVKPLLVTDKPDYTLGFVGDGAKPERVAACHQAYRSLLRRCAEATRAPELWAILRFLDSGPLDQLHLPDDFDPSALLTFRVGERFPTDLPAVRAFWANENDPAAVGATVMQCVVCGQQRPVLERLQGKVKRIPGGQTSGTSIISANANAFESYGLEASLVAPTCADCGERFTKALNELIDSETNRVFLGDLVVVCWTREATGFNFLTFLDDPSTNEVQALFASVARGGPLPEVDDTAFYAVALSASGGRAVVRDWIDTTVGVVKANLRDWFERQAIADDRGGPSTPLSAYWLARATVRDAQDLRPNIPRALIRTALTGTPLPLGLLYQAVRRNRAEQKVTRQRAALIKLVLLSNHPSYQEWIMADLNLNNPEPAYQYGRLLAVLAEIQRAAIGKASVIDRFYGTASSAPAAVFGRLLRGAQPHLAKLERDRPGVATALQRRLEEVMRKIDGFYPTLTLEQQGLFALGFYHQRAHDRAQIQAAVERKRAGSANPDETDLADIAE